MRFGWKGGVKIQFGSQMEAFRLRGVVGRGKALESVEGAKFVGRPGCELGAGRPKGEKGDWDGRPWEGREGW